MTSEAQRLSNLHITDAYRQACNAASQITKRGSKTEFKFDDGSIYTVNYSGITINLDECMYQDMFADETIKEFG